VEKEHEETCLIFKEFVLLPPHLVEHDPPTVTRNNFSFNLSHKKFVASCKHNVTRSNGHVICLAKKKNVTSMLGCDWLTTERVVKPVARVM